jgi:hypothetical protein
MYEYAYKYQNYLRNESPSMGPLYTSFIVALEMYMETTVPLEAVTWHEEQMAEIG